MSNYLNCKTILCIDDDDGVLGFHRALLERRGYAVLTASSPRSGLQLAAAFEVAAVVVDYHMPEMDGLEVAAEIRRTRPQVPIIMVSSDVEVPEQSLQVVDAFISKDEAPRRLLPMISRICGESSYGMAESGGSPA